MAHINYPCLPCRALLPGLLHNSGPLVLSGFTRNEAVAARMLFYSYRTHLSRQRSLSPLKQEELRLRENHHRFIRQEDQLTCLPTAPTSFSTPASTPSLAGLSNLDLPTVSPKRQFSALATFTTEEPEDENGFFVGNN